MVGVAIGPLDGLGSAVVVTDVAHELAGQVLDRGEDPAGNHIALDLGKPVLDLVEPGGVGRSVVEMHFGVSREELLNPLGLMGREIVRNDVNLLAARLADDQVGEEGHKLLAGVARGGFAHHLAPAGVERGVKRKGAVAVVLKAVALQPPHTPAPPSSACPATVSATWAGSLTSIPPATRRPAI